MTLSFVKYAGCGNDFIMIDDRLLHFHSNEAALVRTLCHRQKGIGADGVILLQNGKTTPFKMRIFNSDGSEAEMCGNGLRCLGKFLHDLGEKGSCFDIESMHRRHKVELLDNLQVKATLGKPENLERGVELTLKNCRLKADFMDTGVPHAVIFVEDLEKVDVGSLGREVRHHPRFGPKGANANFVEKKKDGSIHVRTFERGVEAETLACGTGLTAAAVSLHLNSPSQTRIAVTALSQDRVVVELVTDPKGQIEEIFQTGPAEKIFSGTI